MRDCSRWPRTSGSGGLSDRTELRFFSGNSSSRSDQEMCVAGRFSSRRRLAEECVPLSVRDLKEEFGRHVLLTAVRQVQPLRLRLHGQPFRVWLMCLPHRLPGKIARWSDVELWLACEGCGRPRRRLYAFALVPGSLALSELRCRVCHGLTYLSRKSKGRQWYRKVVRPIRRLLRQRKKILGRARPTRNEIERLRMIDEQIFLLSQQLRTRSRPKAFRASAKRKYRDLTLIRIPLLYGPDSHFLCTENHK